MIDNDDRAGAGDPRDLGPSDLPGSSPRGDQDELTALLGHHRSGQGIIVYTDLRPEARVLAGDLGRAPAADEFDRMADALITGADLRRAPVLLITDDRESPDGRVVAAVELARQLGRRELRVVLVDADFRAFGVGGQLGHDDHLGLVDIARYGASPRPCTQATGIANVGLLGVGSFRPDEEEPFSDEELRHALAQARGLSDIVLMVAPTRLRDGSFNPLLAYVDGVVLTVTLRHPSADLLESSVGYLSRLGIAVRGLAVYTQATPAAAGADDASRTRWEPVDVAGAEVGARGMSTAPRVPFQRAPEEADEQLPAAHASLAAAAGDDAHPEVAGSDWLADRDADRGFEGSHVAEDGHQATPSREHSERSSSPVFRLLTLALLVLVLGFGGWWVLVQRSQRALEPLQDAGAVATARELRGEAGAVPRPVEPAAPGPSSTAELAPAEAPAEAPEDAAAEAPPRDPTAAAAPASGTSGADTPASTPPAVAPATRTEPEEAFPEEEIPGNTRAQPREQDPGLRAQLAAPVAPAYALHVWSFPDSLEAVTASAPLSRLGLSPAVRGAFIQQRRWYRVLVGSFASRTDAMAARALLAGQPGIDYVGVVRVQP